MGVPPCLGFASHPAKPFFLAAVFTLQSLLDPARACLLWLRQSSLPLEFSVGSSNQTRRACHIACRRIDRGMKKLIIGGFPPVKNFPCHWFEETAGAIGGSYRVVGQHMTAPSLASAVFILIALAETLGCLPLLLRVRQRSQLAESLKPQISCRRTMLRKV